MEKPKNSTIDMKGRYSYKNNRAFSINKHK